MNPAMNLFNLFRGFDLTDGAWYEPSDDNKVALMVQLLEIQPDEKAVDLGSGDGRLVIALALAGATAVGIEKDDRLVKTAQATIHREGLDKRASIVKQNIWESDLSQYTKVAIYQYETVMGKLKQKLKQELLPGSLIVSHHWQFPDWLPVKQVEDIYVYRR